jgi:hypothetical protein
MRHLPCTVSAVLVMSLISATSCKTTNRARIQSDDGAPAHNGKPLDFASTLAGEVQSITSKIQGIRGAGSSNVPGQPQDNVRSFFANEMLLPYAKAAADYDQSHNKSASRSLAESVRTMLVSWKEFCSKSQWKRLSSGYAARCRDCHNSSLIADAVDLKLIADIVKELEKERGMPAHLAIYFEARYVGAANKRTLDQLTQICQTMPAIPDRSERLVEQVKKMPKPALMGKTKMQAIAKGGLITVDQLRQLADIVADPIDVLREAMNAFDEEAKLFLVEQSPSNSGAVDDLTRRFYRAGRRSVITPA